MVHVIKSVILLLQKYVCLMSLEASVGAKMYAFERQEILGRI